MIEHDTAPLTILETPADMQRWSAGQHAERRRVALVPTMGALHAGHLELIRVAHDHGDVVAVSIFVNPLQFNRADDYDLYPRPVDSDLAACADAGVTTVYAPSAAVMYPDGFETNVDPGTTAEPLEGAGRPGHFRGVCTVVTKLFNAVRPDVAVFGQKDFQQLAVVRRMTGDLDMGIEIVGVPTVREPDGLALSSRNRRLTPEQRAVANCIARGLDAARGAFAGGERNATRLAQTAAAPVETEPLARLEYLAVNDAATLEPVDVVTRPAVMSTAVWFGEVRLIDNVVLDPVAAHG
ncbi:MAG: pantoate--beta-alanine ligase [Ilumatobacteraceae bacterium]